MRTITAERHDDRILLVLQFWKGDQKQAMKLARFIADLQPAFCERADFLFVARFDCPQDMETVKYVSSKFRVFHYQSKRRGTGWPNGCNDLWWGAMEWVYGMIESKKVPHYKAVFTFESDCVPLAANWIHILSGAWDAAQSAQKTFVLGSYQTSPGPHINGNALFSGNLAFLNWIVRKVGGAPPNAGWDFVLYNDFRRWGAANLEGFKSYWGTKTFTEDRFKQELEAGTFFIHGVKDDSLLSFARQKFLGK